MKHILNEMSDEEKNSIRSQHTGSLQVQTERFKKLVENKLGNVKPLISEQNEPLSDEGFVDENELDLDSLDEEWDDEEWDDKEEDDNKDY